MKINLPAAALSALCAVAAHAESSGQILKADVVRGLEDSEKKLVSLAEAMPDDKLAWRPGEGVRSSAEVFLHIAASNYFITGILGAKTPEGVNPKEMEKSTSEKAKVVDQLRKSFAHARETVEKVSEADLVKQVKFGGKERHQQTVLLLLAGHVREHLGQLIAYARSSGVTPPWSKAD